jgi:hypothetical protein
MTVACKYGTMDHLLIRGFRQPVLSGSITTRAKTFISPQHH